MPRLVRKVPAYCRHKASGQAVVTLSGQDFYLGPHGTKASKIEYDRVIAEWLARGRRPLASADPDEISIAALMVRFLRHAQDYYRKEGRITSEVSVIKCALRPLKELFARDAANDFGPLKLKAVREKMIQLGWCRKQINSQVRRIVRMFAWAVEEQLVRADIAQALREVKGLHQGRSEARESDPVVPVDEATVQATIHHAPQVVADMVRLQRLTGARPEEICLTRPGDIDTTGDVWEYRPVTHKNAHRGKERVIFIGPKGQDVLRPYLLRAADAYCFSPADSEKKRRQAAHEARRTPLRRGNRPGTNRSAKPKRPAGERYTTDSYRRAIHRACELAFSMPEELRKVPKEETAEQAAARLAAAKAWRDTHCWSPNQLRHAAATEIRKRFGLEAAQVALGHSVADVTQIYAERDLAKAAAVMREVG